MFTGIVEITGTVASISPAPAGRRLEIDRAAWRPELAAGDSVCVGGCCLTVAADPNTRAGRLAFDVVPETLARTTLGALRAGDRVNLESAATLSTVLGGHLVQGHVDGTALIESVTAGAEHRVRLRPEPSAMQVLAPKGSVALDGVSLTIAGVDPVAGWFEVALIPTTLARTTLSDWRAGSRCNLEADMIAKAVVYWARNFAGARG